MIRRPIVSYSGDEELFNSMKSDLLASLPQETVEWRRSYAHLTRCVHVEVDFAPFREECLSKEPGQGILGNPIFHTFWTNCPDIETYKATVREPLQTWVQNQKMHGCSDWMVILIETPDTKKSNKLLPRTTLLDKFKNDFGGKQSERYISLIDPTKSDSRSVESWQNLLFKMRQLIMVAYNRAVNKFEDCMRVERERRNEKSWSFCKYFLMQEELALVFKLLSLNEDTLVQYDELDALFTQFVLNSAAGDTPHWLSTFSQPCDNKWEGLYLCKTIKLQSKEKLLNKNNITLLEFRNYLFHCQCVLLMELNKPWELAARALNFLQNTIAELRILDVNVTNGGTACWGFLSCLEVINFLYKYKNPSTTDLHALHTAPLWAYARDKLKELGHLCGLMPGGKTSSEQLHIVISLVYGMGDDPHSEEEQSEGNQLVQKSPMTILKGALSSQDAFKNDFLHFSEIAISTYKHIGRIRSARLIGRDLALFYLEEGSPQLAASFLSDQLKTFLEEGWDLLTVHTQMDLMKCFQLMNDHEKFIKMCLQLAACQTPGYEAIRLKAYEDLTKALNFIPDGDPLQLPMDRIFEVGSCKIVSGDPIILGSTVQIQIVITSKLPSEIKCEKLEIQLHHSPEVVEEKRLKNVEIERKCSSSSTSSQASSTRKISSQSAYSIKSFSDIGEPTNIRHSRISEILEDEYDSEVEERSNYSQFLKMNLLLDYNQDKSLSTAYINCSNAHKVLRRRDSHGVVENFEKTVSRELIIDSFYLETLTLNPGKNVLQLSMEITKKGSFVGGQVVLTLKKMHFICPKTSIKGAPLILDVVSVSPHVYLGRKEKDLLAGISQPLILTVKSGSGIIQKDAKIKLKTSRGLLLKREAADPSSSAEEFSKELEVDLPEVKPFDQATLTLIAIANLVPQKDASTIEHMVTITSPILEDPRLDIDVHFVPPFMSIHKLHTANLKKFIQVTVSGLVPQQMELSNPSLGFSDPNRSLHFKLLNLMDQKLTVCSDYSASYMWELDVDYAVEDIRLSKVKFSIDYISKNYPEQEIRTYSYSFDVTNYKTLYTIRAKVDPTKGYEFCRAGNMCNFHISLLHVDHTATKVDAGEGVVSTGDPHTESVMYEVIAEQNMWAVCGRTEGVLTLESGTKQNVVVGVMPLMNGFLPLPSVRLSKYIPAKTKQSVKDGKNVDVVGTASSVSRLEPFSPGQVYNFSRAMQVHVLPAIHIAPSDTSVG